MNALALMRLFQLASQALPVGGFSHSQGLESAVEHGRVTDEASVLDWIAAVLDHSLYRYELPFLHDACEAWTHADGPGIETMNAEFLASRESAELRASTVQMGYSMRALLPSWPDIPAVTRRVLDGMHEPAFPVVWSATTTALGIAARESALAYVWSFVENQVLAAIKTLPLGQSAGQRLLGALGRRVACRPVGATALRAGAISNFAPALAILSARHETQYSRLFRS